MKKDQLFSIDQFSELQKVFRLKEPGVMKTFGGSEYLFQKWWKEIVEKETLKSDFINDYSTNDLFLKNRLILPEEIPFFSLPILKEIIQQDYQKVYFLERGTVPYLTATRRIAEYISIKNVELGSLRVKGMTRENFSTNLLTLVCNNLDDRNFLGQPLTVSERNDIYDQIGIMPDPVRNSFNLYLDSQKYKLEELLNGTREECIRGLGDFGLDHRILIPNILKTVVFKTGNWLLQNPPDITGFSILMDEYCLKLPTQSVKQVRDMINYSIDNSGILSMGAMLEYMNQFVKNIRRNLRHEARPILNLLLKDTQTAKIFFGKEKKLFVDEISVCGSACISLELISKSFNPDATFSFGSIVGMWDRISFLDTVSASFFEYKPIEDLPYLSENYFVPVLDMKKVLPVKPHRFPGIESIGWKLIKWNTQLFSETIKYESMEAPTSMDEIKESKRAEIAIIEIVEKSVPWKDFPLIQRKYFNEKDGLMLILNYYLANFKNGNNTLFFSLEPISDAGLEFVLDFVGKQQKLLYKEIEGLLIWLADWEINSPDQFSVIRFSFLKCSKNIRTEILTRTITEHRQFYDRMNRAMESINQNKKVVFEYLFMEKDRTISSKRFKTLLSILQRSIT